MVGLRLTGISQRKTIVVDQGLDDRTLASLHDELADFLAGSGPGVDKAFGEHALNVPEASRNRLKKDSAWQNLPA